MQRYRFEIIAKNSASKRIGQNCKSVDSDIIHVKRINRGKNLSFSANRGNLKAKSANVKHYQSVIYGLFRRFS